MREAYAGVIGSLKQQLMNATSTTGFPAQSEKQLPVDQSLNQLSVSEIFRKNLYSHFYQTTPIKTKVLMTKTWIRV